MVWQRIRLFEHIICVTSLLSPGFKEPRKGGEVKVIHLPGGVEFGAPHMVLLDDGVAGSENPNNLDQIDKSRFESIT